MTIIFLALWLILLLYGAKFVAKNEWNSEVFSINQAKAFQGFCAVGIALHHLSQRTCANWLDVRFVRHGLDIFVYIGYLMVAVFLFFSGYGLYKSYVSKENYLKGFILKRCIPILFVYLVSEACFLAYGRMRSNYTWYVYAIWYLYIVFFVAFKLIKKENISILFIALMTVVYIGICEWQELGGWWYNTIGLFLIGILVAKNEAKILCFLKNRYVLMIILSIIMFAIMYALSRYLDIILYSSSNKILFTERRIGIVIAQFFAAISFVLLSILIGLKIKIGNRALSLLGSITLEFYLIHGFFVQIFGFAFIEDWKKPLYYIENVPLYVLVVLVCGTLCAWLIHQVTKQITRIINNKIN